MPVRLLGVRKEDNVLAELNAKNADYATRRDASRRLIVVANRAPLEHRIDRAGHIQGRCTPGGVATALDAVSIGTNVTWLASAATEADRAMAERQEAVALPGGRTVRYVAADPEAYGLFYDRFCNSLLWFIQHGLVETVDIADSVETMRAWENGYLSVNRAFARAIIEELDRGPGPAWVMLHDYHFYATPRFVRWQRPEALLQQFVHIPWPEAASWERLPASIVQSLHRGLLANDSIVFQTAADVERFLQTCRAFLGDDVSVSTAAVAHGGRTTRVWWNPVSVDVWDLRSRLAKTDAPRLREQLQAGSPVERTIVRVDRLDPIKGVLEGFRAYARLLERNPDWRGRVRFLAFLVPTRTSVPAYQAYAREVLAEVDAINGRFGGSGWEPIRLYHEQNRPQALAGLTQYDVLLVNSVADGMNLVSKEGPVLNERNGVLVLSTAAGAYAELQRGAIGVQPGDVEGIAEGLQQALEMPAGERFERARMLRAAVLRHDLGRWFKLLLDDLQGLDGLPDTPPAAITIGDMGNLAGRTKLA
jgi:trehalose 6-phosphate synthase